MDLPGQTEYLTELVTKGTRKPFRESLRKCLSEKDIAGEEIRTPDVQLGKIGWRIVEKLRKPRAFQHFSLERHFRKASHFDAS